MIILPLVISMNLIEFFDMKTFDAMNLFKGQHTDFGAKWY